MLATVHIANSGLIDREVLASFHNRVRVTDDVPKLFDEIRAEKARSSQRKPRHLVRRDLDLIGLDFLPYSITLSRGRIEVRFETVEQLAEAMYALARMFDAEAEEFVTLYAAQVDSTRQI